MSFNFEEDEIEDELSDEERPVVKVKAEKRDANEIEEESKA